MIQKAWIVFILSIVLGVVAGLCFPSLKANFNKPEIVPAPNDYFSHVSYFMAFENIPLEKVRHDFMESGHENSRSGTMTIRWISYDQPHNSIVFLEIPYANGHVGLILDGQK